MKRIAFVLCLALWGCGGAETGDVTGETGETGDVPGASAACALAIERHGELYLGAVLDGEHPPPGAPVEGGIQPSCGDGGSDEDRPIALREVSGVPPEVAVYVEGDAGTIYVNRRHDLADVLQP